MVFDPGLFEFEVLAVVVGLVVVRLIMVLFASILAKWDNPLPATLFLL